MQEKSNAMTMGVLRVHCFGSHTAYAVFDRKISEATSDYRLYTNRSFLGVPINGDPYGIVAQAVAQALLADSGATMIVVQSHLIQVIFSTAASEPHCSNFLPRVMRTVCGNLPWRLEFV